MMQDPIIVDIYCRSATEPQEGINTLDEQEQICRDYCAAQGLKVGNVYREVFSGMQLKQRPLLNRLRQRYLVGTIQGVVITRLDRLSRSIVHSILLVNEMETHHIQLYVVEEELADSLEGRWLLALSVFLRTAEREKNLEL
jgi:DNA invertase Pin-like site-specific DNA recombinase